MSKSILPLPGSVFQTSSQDDAPSGTAPGGNGPPQRPGSGKPTYSKRGKITIVACVPCRKRKTKCDGKRPHCTQCTARDGTCHYDMSEEQRRLTYLRENVEHLADEKNTLASLIWNLRNSTDNEAAEILRRLRNGTDPATLNQHIQAGRSLAQVRSDLPPEVTGAYHPMLMGTEFHSNPYERLVNTLIVSSPTDVDEILRRLRLQEDAQSVLNSVQSGSLIQPLLDGEADVGIDDDVFGLSKISSRSVAENEGQASREADGSVSQSRDQWISASDDQDFIEHLITTYFTWQHSFFQSFPEALFRSDMLGGKTDYCSRALVNAVCAAGWLLSPRTEDRRDSNEPSIPDIGFFDEAVRLLKEVQNSSLPAVAALFLICHVEGYRGHLGLVWNYCGQSSRMALDLNLHLRAGKDVNKSNSTEDPKTEERARVHAFWGCFIADQVIGFTLGRLPQLPVNAITIELPHIIKEDDDEPWIAYGVSEEPRPGCRSTCFHEVASLSKIVNSTLMMFFAPSETIKGRSLLNEYEKYQSWYARLPDLVKSINNAPPHVLCLHIYYHAAVLLLFRPFLKAQFTESDVSPREVCRHAANQISVVFDEHRRLYDKTGIYTFQLHCLLTACTIHIINLPTISSTAYLTTACNHFHDLAPRNAWAASCLSIIKGLVQKWNIILPREPYAALYRRSDDPFATPGAEIPPFTSMPSDSEASGRAKRSAYPNVSPDVFQKRQKLQPMETAGAKEPPTNYLFAPFPNQPAPLLRPVHTSSSADTAWKEEVEQVTHEFEGLKFEGDGWFDPFLGNQGDDRS